MRIQDVTTWEKLAAARRTNSSFKNWSRLNPGTPQAQDIASLQVGALKEAVLKERRKESIGVQGDLDDQHVRMMRPMGLLLLKRR